MYFNKEIVRMNGLSSWRKVSVRPVQRLMMSYQLLSIIADKARLWAMFANAV